MRCKFIFRCLFLGSKLLGGLKHALYVTLVLFVVSFLNFCSSTDALIPPRQGTLCNLSLRAMLDLKYQCISFRDLSFTRECLFTHFLKDFKSSFLFTEITHIRQYRLKMQASSPFIFTVYPPHFVNRDGEIWDSDFCIFRILFNSKLQWVAKLWLSYLIFRTDFLSIQIIPVLTALFQGTCCEAPILSHFVNVVPF